MATPDPSQLRSDLTALTGMASRNLGAFWPMGSTAEEARDALIEVLPALVDTYGEAAATIAADWYDDSRARLEVDGDFRALPAELGETGSEVLVKWGVAPLFQAVSDWEAARSLIEGGMQRRIVNAARVTVTESSLADPEAEGWKRAGLGGCDFCKMLIGRGAVYREATASFASHDHCRCLAVPAWSGGGSAIAVGPYRQSQTRQAVAGRAARARRANARAEARARARARR